MRKILSLMLLVSFVFSFVSTSGISKAQETHLYQVGVVGTMPADYLGVISIASANTVESDFHSEYSIPMQGMATLSNGDIVYCDTGYGRVHILSPDLQDKLTFGDVGMGDGKLQYPVATAVDKDDNIYVADFFGDYFAKFDKTGGWLMNVGTEGTGDGQFKGSAGIAVDKDGNIYVSDELNGRVEIFDPTGKFVKSFTDSNLSMPGGMAIDKDGNLLVVDLKIAAVNKYSLDGKFISKFGEKGTNDGQLLYPSGVSVDKDNNVYVVDRGYKGTGAPLYPRVQKFDSTGKFLLKIGSRATKVPLPDGTFLCPDGLTIGLDGKVYVMDAGYFYGEGNPFGRPDGARLTVFDASGNFVMKRDADIHAEGRLLNNWSACKDSTGKIWSTSWNNFSDYGEVVIFDASGKYLKTIKGISDTDQFNTLGGIVSDGKGKVYLGLGDAIAVFDENGNFITKIGDKKVSGVMQLTFDGSGNLWCASKDTQNVVIFKPDGTILNQFTVAKAPYGLAVLSDGSFVFTSSEDAKAYFYTKDGQLKKSIGGGSRAFGNFWVPYGALATQDGNVLISDIENGNIQCFDKDGNFLWSTPRAFYGAVMMSLGADGNIYLADSYHGVIRILSTTPPKVPDFDFTASSSSSKIEVKAGAKANFNIIVRNTGKNDDTYNIVVDTSSLPSAWTVSDLPKSVSVKSFNQAVIPVTVSTTADSTPGTLGNLVFSLASSGDTAKKASITVTVAIQELPPVAVTLDQNLVPLNGTQIINVVTQEVGNLYGVAVTLQYDPALLQVVEVKPSGILGSDAMFLEDHSKAGTITVGYTLKGKAAGVKAAGSLIGITFKGLKEGETDLAFSDVSMSDDLGNSIKVTAKDVKVTVYNAAPPSLLLDFMDNVEVKDPNFVVSGKTDIGAKVTVNDKPASVGPDGKFSISVQLTEGTNSITVVSENKYGVKTTLKRNVILKTTTIIVLQIGSSSFTVNEVPSTLDSPPVIKNSRTLVPIRAIIEAMGGTISWDGTEKKVTITLKDTIIELWINKPQAKVNGEVKWIDDTNHKVVPEIINSRTMLPLRFVTENLGAEVLWDGTTKTITITYVP